MPRLRIVAHALDKRHQLLHPLLQPLRQLKVSASSCCSLLDKKHFTVYRALARSALLSHTQVASACNSRARVPRTRARAGCRRAYALVLALHSSVVHPLAQCRHRLCGHHTPVRYTYRTYTVYVVVLTIAHTLPFQISTTSFNINDVFHGVQSRSLSYRTLASVWCRCQFPSRCLIAPCPWPWITH